MKTFFPSLSAKSVESVGVHQPTVPVQRQTGIRSAQKFRIVGNTVLMPVRNLRKVSCIYTAEDEDRKSVV